MNTKYIVILVLLIVILVLMPLISVWNFYNKPEESSTVTTKDALIDEEIDERAAYSIPENTIPTVDDIENKIHLETTTKAMNDKSKAYRDTEDTIKELARQIDESKYDGGIAAPEKAASQSLQNAPLLPEKKEVRFPTKEERKTSEKEKNLFTF